MTRKIILTPDELYHVYNRGTEKRKIFMDAADYTRFIELLFFCNSSESVRIDDLHRRAASQGSTLRELFPTFERKSTLVDLCAYCLMPNHFHLLIHEKKSGGISRFMQKVSTGYTMYFNTRYERTGSLLQGKYQALHASEDRYLKYLLSYIHLNPVKLVEPRWREVGVRNYTAAEKYLASYRWSSLPDYCGNDRTEKHLLAQDVLAEYYDDPLPHTFKESVAEWLEYREFNPSL